MPLPNLQRLYFKVLEPIDAGALGIDAKDAAAWQALYDAVRGAGELCVLAEGWGGEGSIACESERKEVGAVSGRADGAGGRDG